MFYTNEPQNPYLPADHQDEEEELTEEENGYEPDMELEID